MIFSRPVRGIQRLRDVQAVLLRYGFDILIDQEEIKEVRRLLRDKLHLKVGEFSDKSVAERVRLMLEELGPTYVKLGQLLSSRSGFLPISWTSELSKLQDAVPPFPFEDVQCTIEEDFNKPLDELFFEFDPCPMAAASIGQAHHATLLTLEPVVVKVRRPDVIKKVEADLDIIREVARLVEARTKWGKMFGAVAIVEELGRTLHEEMDYTNEAANADRLRRNMAGMPEVNVPYIYHDLVSNRVLTMERIEGVKIDNLEAMDQAGVNRQHLAKVFIQSIFKQSLVDGFFHADPHPANLLINLEDHSLNYIDLGMTGSLLPEQREQLSDIVNAIIERDSRETVRLLLTIAPPYETINKIAFQREVDRIVNRYLDASLEQINFAPLLQEILGIIAKHGVRLPSELSMAVKSLMLAESVGRTLDPGLEIIEIARTIYEQVVRERLDPRNLTGQLIRTLREFMRMFRSLPRASESLLEQVENGKIQFGVDLLDFPEQLSHLTNITNRMTAGLIIAGMAIGSAIAMVAVQDDAWIIIRIVGIIGFVLCALVGNILVWMVFIDMWRSRKKKK